ncbi:hypothetical protein [Streptomyces albidoflavus]|uniref:alpha/beta hydrolase n=1 Tax=Streptomyces albidoflavus TaxID=1886 RepID=UPI00340C67F8
MAPFPRAHGPTAAVQRRTGRRLPVVVFSHGAHSHQGDHTVMVQELAGHGYAVVTVAHHHDTYTVFPDGRVAVPRPDVPMPPGDFAADLRFVLDCVELLAAGHNPDAGRRKLPAGLPGSLDPRRIGAFGWSKEGTATACATLADDRIRAGLSLDGPDADEPAALRRPGPAVHDDDRRVHPGHRSRGRRVLVAAARPAAEHPGPGRRPSLVRRQRGAVPQVAKMFGWSEQELQDVIGTLDPVEAVKIQQAYSLAFFFDEHLRHRRGHLLDGPSPDFPAVVLLP